MKRIPYRSTSILTAALLLGLFSFGCADQNSNLTAPDGQLAETGETQFSLARPVPQEVFGAAIEAQEKRTGQLLTIPGVVGTAVGLSAAGQPEVKIYVETARVSGLPRQIDGIRVSVEVVGKIVALQEAKPRKCATPPCGGPGSGGGGGGGDDDSPEVDRTARFDRPVPIGVSTGHPAITAGTIGARVTDGTKVYALSNNHVYADENMATAHPMNGDAVIQPGTFDGGSSPADDIGTLADFEPIDFSGGDNVIDAAIALSSTANLGNATPPDGYGTPQSTTVDPAVGTQVKKYGRTTGQTNGKINAINAIVLVGYGSGTARFINQIIIRGGNFSAGGDSGSLIVVRGGMDDGKAVGLLYAGGAGVTVANPIGPVLSAFGVTIDGQ